MSKNYYEQLLENVRKLIDSKKNELAIEMIEEELNLPYVPKIYEEELTKYLSILKKETKNNKNHQFSKDEIIVIMNEYKKYDVDFLLNVTTMFDQYNWNGYEIDIENILNYSDLDPKAKSMIYNNLAIQNINYDFKINSLTINPFKNKTIFETNFVLKNLEAIIKKQIDDISIIDICKKILFIYVMNMFPNSLFIEYENIANELINISKVMIGLKSVEELSTKEKGIYNIINLK